MRTYPGGNNLEERKRIFILKVNRKMSKSVNLNRVPVKSVYQFFHVLAQAVQCGGAPYGAKCQLQLQRKSGS